MQPVDIAKANRNRLLGSRDKDRDKRAKAMRAKLEAWMAKYSAKAIADATKDAQRAVVRKQQTDKQLEDELREILRQFGVAAWNDAASQGARAGGVEWVVPPGALDELIRSKEIQLKNIMEETRALVDENIRTIIADALQENPRPSSGEIARRIRRTFAGPGQSRGVDEAGDRKRGWVFSPERAELIAQTELAQSLNTGIVDGYKATGIEYIEWIAYGDGRSGDRKHDKLDGKVRRVGDYFRTHLGNDIRWPGDPLADIKETARCRCTTAPHKGPATK